MVKIKPYLEISSTKTNGNVEMVKFIEGLNSFID